jgi:hypothetical protein
MASKTSAERSVQFLKDIFGKLGSDERILIDVRKPDGSKYNSAHHGPRTYASFEEILEDPWYKETVGKGDDQVLISDVLDQMFCVTTVVNEKVEHLDKAGKLKKTDWPTHKKKWCARTSVIGFDIDCLRNEAFMTEGVLDPDDDTKWLEAPEYILEPGAFLSDIQGNEFISGWVQSSEAGIQGYIKLDKPVLNPYLKDEDKTRDWCDDSGFQKLQAAITYYWGGDFAVAKWGSLMRLPGSYNAKDKYDTRFRVVWKPKQDVDPVTLGELKKKFDGNLYRPPVPVGNAIVQLFSDHWDNGSGRHQKALAFGGSCAHAGLPEQAALKLMNLVCKSYSDRNTDDRLTAVKTSYDALTANPNAKIVGLSSVLPEISEPVIKILKWWATYMKEYTKKIGVDDATEVPATGVPETKERTGAFYEHDGSTWYISAPKKGKGDEEGSSGGPAIFGNWVLNLLGHIERDHPETPGQKVRVPIGEISVANGRKSVVEISTNSAGTFIKFAGIPGIEGLVACQAPNMWAKYIADIYARCPKHIVPHTSFYGVLNLKTTDEAEESGSHELSTTAQDIANVEFDEAILFAPEDQGLDTLLLNTEGIPIPAVDNAFSRKTTPESELSYLRNFPEAWLNYHDESFVVPLLGYFAYAFISQWGHILLGARPTLFITGPTNSAKSAVVESITKHFGVKSSLNQYEKTTPHALKLMLSVSNVQIIIIDEFRNSHERQLQKRSYEALVRGLFDDGKSASGGRDGKITESNLMCPIIIMGENCYDDNAAVDRTHIIEVSRSWVTKVDQLEGADKRQFNSYREWIEDNRRKRMMSTIVWRWLGENQSLVPSIYAKAVKEIEEESDTTPRKRKAQSCIYAGMLLLRQVYKSYGLTWPMKNKDIKRIIINAGADGAGSRDNDREALRTLFQITDQYISNSVAMGRDLKGSIIETHPDDGNLLVFDTSRWYRDLAPRFRGETAALQTQHAFEVLLKEALTNSDKGIVGIDIDHAKFRGGNVCVDLETITSLYKVNAVQWGRLICDPESEIQRGEN